MAQRADEPAVEHVVKERDKDQCQTEPQDPVPDEVGGAFSLEHHEGEEARDDEEGGHPPAMRPLHQDLQPEIHFRDHVGRDAEIPEPVGHLGDVVELGSVKDDAHQYRE